MSVISLTVQLLFPLTSGSILFFVCMISQVMLVSLCAGGVGINLIGGNHLFLIDMHW